MDPSRPRHILFIDDDQILARIIGRYLTSVGFRVTVVADGQCALEEFKEHRPDLVITDLCMPVMGGVRFLEEVRKLDSLVPVIVTTGFPDIDTAIAALRNGAYDYLRKPFQLDLLHSKIEEALRASRTVRERAALSELTSLYQITSKLTAATTLHALLEQTFQYCLDVSCSHSGAISVLDRRHDTLVPVHYKGVIPTPGEMSGRAVVLDTCCRWVQRNGSALLVTEGTVYPDVGIELAVAAPGSWVFLPLRVGNGVTGVVSLWRNEVRDPFSLTDLAILEVLVAQAGIAIDNAQLYASVNQKLEELSLVSSYSEQLRGLTDEDQIVSCLFGTVPRHFSVDFIGFLVVLKRKLRFLYWSRGPVAQPVLRRICSATIDFYNEKARTICPTRRVDYVRTGEPENGSEDPFGSSPAFELRIPVVWEGTDYGAIYFGSGREPDNPEEKISLLSSLVNQTRIALTNSRLYGDMKENYIRTIKALAIAVDAKDTYTHGHSENVMNVAQEIAEELGMDKKFVDVIRDAGLLHDIGKIGIPGSILNKPGPLTYDEFNGIMKTHSSLGANIVRDVPFLHDLYTLILYHHEHFDGSGYPEGLQGEEIPLGARILHVADAFEAMTSNRPYRTSLGPQEAIRRLHEGSGTQFDPRVVEAMHALASRKGWAPVAVDTSLADSTSL